jgi:hypothetical protein
MERTLKLLGMAFLFMNCIYVVAKKSVDSRKGSEGAAPVVIASGERILKGAIVVPGQSYTGAFEVLFRGKKCASDPSGFYTFPVEAPKETFEATPFKQKMMKSMQAHSAPDQPLPFMQAEDSVNESPLLSSKGHPDKYYILISKSVEPVFEGTNDISGFKQKEGAPHLFFSCFAQNSASAEEPNIVIKPRSMVSRNYTYAPDKTIVILMNPNRVAKIEYWPFKLDSQFIQLPRIILQTEDEIIDRKRSKKVSSSDEGVLDDDAPRAASGIRKDNLMRQSIKSQMYGANLAHCFEAPDVVEVSKRIARNQWVDIRM